MQRADERLAVRRRSHEQIAAELDGSSDEQLLHLLSHPLIRQRGHAVLSLPHSDTEIFVKLVPLTDCEMQPLHRGSTANVFGLPTYYQYRIGSAGFGAWRELEVQRLASEWVTSGQDARFPILHHWRALPIVSRGEDDKTTVQPWGDCPAIRQRVAAISGATTSVVLFLECFPLTLGEWLREQLSEHTDPASVVVRVEQMLTELFAFTRGEGLLHMDAHFGNILTDGNQLYLADFGLALSKGFELGPDEQRFFDEHQDFDPRTAINSLVHAVVVHYDAADDWRRTLRALIDGTHDTSAALPVGVRTYLTDKAPVALAIGEFYARLLENLSTR